MKRALLPLLAASLLLTAACTSTNPESEQAAAVRAENAANRPPGSPEVLGAYDPGTPETTSQTTGDALRAFSDTEFLLAAASSSEMEIQLGQLAAQQGSSAAVKQYGQMMVDHHTAALQEQSAVNTQLDVRPSAAIMTMHQDLVDRLKDKTGADFDKRYLNVMQTAHKLDIVMFETKEKRADNPAVQALAAKTLPTLRAHLEEAKALDKQMK